MKVTENDTPHLNEVRSQALLEALKALSDQYCLGIDSAALATAERPHPEDASFYLHALFPQRTVSHTEELGEAPEGAYPRLLAAYAAATNGEFDPQSIAATSDDDWDSLSLVFRNNNKEQRFKVNGVEDSDWFIPDFVQALNRYAERQNLSGRWVDFHNGDDECTSIYVPETAQAHFKDLKKKYSCASEEEESSDLLDLLKSAGRKLVGGLVSKFQKPPPEIPIEPLPEVHLSDKQLANRKTAWVEVEAALLADQQDSNTKALQHYYLSGREPDWNQFSEPDPIPLHLRLWLHPDQSDASWNKITARVLSYEKQDTIRHSLTESREWLDQDSRKMSEIFSEPKERLIHFLQGQSLSGERYRFLGEPLYPYHGFSRIRYGLRCVELSEPAGNDSHPTVFNSELIEDWVEFICDPYFEQLIDVGNVNGEETMFCVYLRLIAAYKPPVVGDPDHLRQHYCQRIRIDLDSRTLPPLIDEWWVEAKGTDH